MRFVTAPLVSPTSAEAIFGSATTHSSSFTGVNGLAGNPPEIVELARALKNDPDLIYEYVHNQVETEFAFGLRKGPLGAVIDKSGTPFDQNVLFVNLVRQAGYQARYRLGRVTLTEAQFQDWTGGISDQQAACRMLASGGIPAAFNGASSTSANCSDPGPFTSVTILHVWSEVNIGGTWYAYDPSVKSHTVVTSVDLVGGAGITSGAAATQAASGEISGTQSGSSYIKNVNTTSLETYLAARGTQLVTTLKTSAPASDTDTVVGIPKIVAVFKPAGGWRNSTPPGYTAVADTTIPGDMPDQYRTGLNVNITAYGQSGAIAHQLYADEVYGRRITIDSNFDKDDITQATDYCHQSMWLAVDDVPLQTYTLNLPTGQPAACGPELYGSVTLAITHPYASGTYANETLTRNASFQVPIAVVAGFGTISPKLAATWWNEHDYDKSMPLPVAGYPAGQNNACDPQFTCYPEFEAPAGEKLRQAAAAGWLAQFSRMLQLQAAVSNTVAQHHHSIGLASLVYGWVIQDPQVDIPPSQPRVPNYPTDFAITDSYAQVDVDSTLSITSKVDDFAKVAAVSRSVAAASAMLEGSVVEQGESLPDGASTASRFGWANAPDNEDPCNAGPRGFYDFTGSTTSSRTGVLVMEGRTAGCGSSYMGGTMENAYGTTTYSNIGTSWESEFDGAIASYLSAGFTVHGPGESFLGPGSRVGLRDMSAPWADFNGTYTLDDWYFPTHQRGGAFVATLTDGSGNVLEVAHIVGSKDGVAKGGGGKEPARAGEYDPNKAAEVLKDRFIDRSSILGVDLKTGAAGWTSPVIASIGPQEPYGLAVTTSFKNAPVGCAPQFGPCTGAPGGGWDGNWDFHFSLSSSGTESLGATSPRAAAGGLVAMLAMQDLYEQSGVSDLQKDVYAALIADWWRRQIVGNVATVGRGFSAEQYVRLVDGTWLAPVGSPGVLTQTGVRTKVRDYCNQNWPGTAPYYSISRRWDASNVTFSLRKADGEVMSFAPWKADYSGEADQCAITYGFKITSWTWPKGVSLTFTTDSFGSVTNVTTSTGRSLPSAGPSTISSAGTKGTFQDAAGAAWGFDLLPPVARSATQRPLPYFSLSHIYEPTSATLPALEYDYDSLGRVMQAKDADALQLGTRGPHQFFIADGGRGERDDPLGGVYTVNYDRDGHAVRHVDELGRTTVSVYDGQGRVSSRTFPKGDQEAFTYDLNDHVLSLTRTAVPGSVEYSTLIVVSATWDPTWGKLATLTDALNNVTTFTYVASGNGAGELATATHPAPVAGGTHPVYSFTYGAFGRLATATDPTGLVTQNIYDATTADLLSTTVDPGSAPHVNSTTQFTYDSQGNVVTTTDPLGNVTNTTYDADRRKVFEIAPDPDGVGPLLRPTVKHVYDAMGHEIETDKGTATTTTASDFSALETTLMTYDPAGNKISQAMPTAASQTAAGITQISYDAMNRPVCTAVRENQAVFGSLPDPCALSVEPVTGSFGPDRITEMVYDLAGQKLQEIHGLGTTAQETYATHTYGLDGEAATIADANGNVTTYVYDGFLRLKQTQFPSTPLAAGTSDVTDVESYTYDANGNRLSLTKRDGSILSFCYDTLNRQTVKYQHAVTNCQTAASGNDVSSAYDLAGRPTSVLFAGSGTGVVYGYDTAGRMTSQATNGRSMSFLYDLAGNRTRVTWPDAFYAGYLYDNDGRVTTINENGATSGVGKLAVYAYDNLGRVTSLTRGNGTSTSLGYDLADRLSSLAHAMPGDTGHNQTLGYVYSPASQQVTRTWTNTAYSWTNHPTSAVTATYDGLNRDASIAATNMPLCPTATIPAGAGFDCNGNQMLDKAGVRKFAYDIENRLISVTGVPTTVALTYDPLGRLQQEQATTSGTMATTQFLYEGDKLSAEYDGSGNLLRRYVHGTGQDVPLVWYEGVLGTTDRRFLHVDRQGTVIAQSNSSGGVTQVYAYGPYGEPQAWGGSRFQYTGQIAIPEAQLYHYKARVYDPMTGRFLQTDPIGYQSDLDLYAYVEEDPLDKGDPTGDGPEIVACAATGPAAPVCALGDLAVTAAVVWVGGWMITHPAPPLPNVHHNQQAKPEGKKPPSPNGRRGSKEHQDRVKGRIEELKDEGMTHVGGGDKPEETVRTPGGEKGSRSPDITMERPDGSRYRENVGRTNQNGEPAARERRAKADIEKATGQCAFTSYTSCK
jgi:RHS repeat-associated protein